MTRPKRLHPRLTRAAWTRVREMRTPITFPAMELNSRSTGGRPPTDSSVRDSWTSPCAINSLVRLVTVAGLNPVSLASSLRVAGFWHRTRSSLL